MFLAQPDLTKTTEVTDPELFQRIQDQLKKDLETQEEVELVTEEVAEPGAFRAVCRRSWRAFRRSY